MLPRMYNVYKYYYFFLFTVEVRTVEYLKVMFLIQNILRDKLLIFITYKL